MNETHKNDVCDETSNRNRNVESECDENNEKNHKKECGETNDDSDVCYRSDSHSVWWWDEPTHDERVDKHSCGLEQYACLASATKARSVKFDTAASAKMTGRVEDLTDVYELENPVGIKGFDNSMQRAGLMGTNSDGFPEMVVPQMPDHLSLKSGHGYVAGSGAAVLFKDMGVVLKLTAAEEVELKRLISNLPVRWRLKVVNRTYEFDDDCESAHVVEVNDDDAMSAVATRYFNTKVNVSNGEQRVLTMMLMGLSFQDLYSLVTNKSLGGMPPDLTKRVLNQFSHRYGRTPDIIRLANPIKYKSLWGLMSYEQVVSVGQRVEIDQMHPDGNVTENGKTRKLESFGGATSALVYIDVFSGYVFGKLLTPKAVFVEEVKEVTTTLKELGVDVKLLAADSGIVSNSKFDEYDTIVQQILRKVHIEYERVEPNNHSRGGAVIEVTIRLIKQLIRLATVYVLTNPNFEKFKMEKLDVFRMWGELFNWSIIVINLKPCPNVPHKTRFEVFQNKVPNMQDIRLLPIFSCVQVYRPIQSRVFQEKAAENRKVAYSTNLPSLVVALYVGPDKRTKGAIRAAVKVKGNVQVYVTSRFTAASDGGGLNIHSEVENGVKEYINSISKKGVTGVTPNTDDVDVSIGYDTVAVLPDTNEVEEEIEEAAADLPAVTTESPAAESIENNSEVVAGDEGESSPTVDPSPENEVRTPGRRNRYKKRLRQSKSERLSAVDTSAEPSKGVSAQTDSKYTKEYSTSSLSRSERLERRHKLGGTAFTVEDVENVCLAFRAEEAADSAVQECDANEYYLNLVDGRIIQFGQYSPGQHGDYEQYETVYLAEEYAFRAVTGPDLPKDFQAALNHKIWGKPAHKEKDTLLSTYAIVKMDPNLARDMLKRRQADLVVLFPVYEKKIKDGEEVLKVRLVGDGRTHYNAGDTYSGTPSREEFLILLQLIASLEWEYAHVDEVRAFLNASYNGKTPVIATMRGTKEFYMVHGALYGLKTSPRDYQEKVRERLKNLGFTRLVMCQCIYTLREGSSLCFVYDFVDDFFFLGYPKEFVDMKINELREVCTTTEPNWDATRVLGLELKRDRSRKIICVTMTEKIVELHDDHVSRLDLFNKRKTPIMVPMPTSGYIVHEEDFAQRSEEEQALLDEKDKLEYMSIVGGLIWISGIRVDILYAVMYLTWSTKSPRGHHLYMARYCVQYLHETRYYPLVLGGESAEGKVNITAYTDASLGTATKGRSVRAHAVKLNEAAGSVLTKTGTSTGVLLSSFESELDGAAEALKGVSRVEHILEELKIACGDITLYGDNKAMVEFVKGNSIAKNVKHMELRLFFVKRKIEIERYLMVHKMGPDIQVDKLTKLGDAKSQGRMVYDLMGHKLLYIYGEKFDLVGYMTELG